MERLLVAFLFLLCSPAFAGGNPTPELITFQQFQMLNPVKKQLYLELVSAALWRFEAGITADYESAEMNIFDQFHEQFVLNFSPLPKAFADANCPVGLTIGQSTPNSGVCIKYPRHPENPKDNSFVMDCREKVVGDYSQKCPQAAAKYVNSTQALNKYNKDGMEAAAAGYYAGIQRQKQEAAAKTAQDKARQDADLKAQEKAAQEKYDKERHDVLEKVANDPKHGANMTNAAGSGAQCPPLNLQEQKKLRKAYRKKGNACLVGGVISGYSKPGKPCDVVQSKPADEDEAIETAGHKPAVKPAAGGGICGDGNMFTTGDVGKIPRARRTICQNLLYCKKDKSPFCVEASADTLGNCNNAVKTQKDKFAFGKDCMDDNNDKARTAWNKLSASLSETCNPQSEKTDIQNKILCNDCKNLAQALHEAEAQAGPPPAQRQQQPRSTGTSTR